MEQETIIKFRLFIDEFFWETLIKSDSTVRIFQKLSDIHKFSKLHPLHNNIMFDESFKKAIKDNHVPGSLFLGACHPVQIPNFLESEDDFSSQVIKYSINMATKAPFLVFILTSSKQKKVYEKNKHYKNNNVSEVIKVLDFNEAVEFIDIINNIL